MHDFQFYFVHFHVNFCISQCVYAYDFNAKTKIKMKEKRKRKKSQMFIKAHFYNINICIYLIFIYLIFNFPNYRGIIKQIPWSNYRPFHETEIQCICNLDFGKGLWNWLYKRTKTLLAHNFAFSPDSFY